METESSSFSSSTQPILDKIESVMGSEYSMTHHHKKGPDLTRPRYRDGRKKTAVKAYCVSQESQYLLIHSVPTLNLYKELKDKFKQFGRIELLMSLPDYPHTAPFTEVYLLKYELIANARTDDVSFYGEVLHVCYAPEFESVSECRLKLHDRRVKVRSQMVRNAREREEFQQRGNSQSESAPSASHDDISVNTRSVPPPPPPPPPPQTTPAPYVSPVVCLSRPPPPLPSPQFRPYLHSGPRIGWDYAKVRSADAPSECRAPIDNPRMVSMPTARCNQLVPLPVQQAMAWRPVTPLESHTAISHRLLNSSASSHDSSSIKAAAAVSASFDFQPPRLSSSRIPESFPPATLINSASKLVPRQLALKVKSSNLKAESSVLGPEHGPQLPSSVLAERRKRAAEQGPMQSLDWKTTVQKIRKISSLK